MSLFGAPAANPSSLFQMKAGKATLAGTTVTSDARKGLLVLRKSEDGLMHLIWQDRTTGTVEDDLIVFPGDASLRHLPAAKDGFTMLLEFTTGRKLFFWSQETRKKGLDWTKPEDIAKETEMMNKANTHLSGNTGPAPAATAAPSAGFGGMSHAELMAMLSGPAVVPPASTPAAPAAAPSDAAPAPETLATPAPAATPAAPAAATPAPASGFSADAISSILSGISVPPAAAPAALPAAGGFSASSISSILGNIAAQGAPVALNEVIRPESTVRSPPRSASVGLHLWRPPVVAASTGWRCADTRGASASLRRLMRSLRARRRPSSTQPWRRDSPSICHPPATLVHPSRSRAR